MNNQIVLQLKSIIDDVSARGVSDIETKRNSLKEELQYYVLNFIYHHPEYSNWTMYGGSALRICHGLDRMSVDLDFEIPEEINEEFIGILKSEINDYFIKTYGIDSSFLTIKENNNRGIRLNFNIGKELDLGHTSDMVHIKIDLNCFTAPKLTTEKIPINHGQFSFVIKTYNMSNLMSSKIAAIFLRGQRGVGNNTYEEKGRDIYDLLWYMNKKIIPDVDYLKAKNVNIDDAPEIFNKLTIKMNDVSDKNLEDDLKPLFLDQSFILNWLKNWRMSYLHLLNGYKIQTIKDLKEVVVFQDFRNDTFHFIYYYNTIEDKMVRVIYNLSDYWIEFRDGDISLSVKEDESLNKLINFNANGVSSRPASEEKLKKYVNLFFIKNNQYFKKTKNIMFGDVILTKMIRMTADDLNQKEQIVLNRGALLSCELEDLLK